MDAQELRNLQEAYMEVVENQQLDEGMTLADYKKNKSAQRAKAKREADKIAPNRRKDIHTDRLSPERAARHRANVDPDFEGNDERNYPGGRLRPNKKRKAEALGELGEQNDVYDIILSHLLDEGYADTEEAAEAIMVNMSEDWRENIIEAEVLAAKGGVPGTVQVKSTREGGFLGIGGRTVNRPVPGTFKPKDVSSSEAARFNTQLDRNNTIGRGTPPASVVQRRARQSGHSGYMHVKNPDSIPNTGIPNRPTPQRAADQNQARQPGWS